MKSYKIQPTDAVYWTVDKGGHRRGFAGMFAFGITETPSRQIEDYGDLIKDKTVKSELLRIMYDTQK